MAQAAPTTYTGTARISVIAGALGGGLAIEVDTVDGSDNFKTKVENKNYYIYVKSDNASATGQSPNRVYKAFDVEIKATKSYSFKIYESGSKLYLYEAPDEQ